MTLDLGFAAACRRRAWPGLCVAFFLLVAGCDSDSNCSGGGICECAAGTDCYLGCDDSGCNLRLHDLVHAGGICGDNCQQECFAVTDCTLSCGDGCSSRTHDTTSSGTSCGDNCQHECFNVDRCGVSAGANSIIDCHNLTTCEIYPLGPGSMVKCNAIGGTCRVDCVGTCQVQYTIDKNKLLLTCPASAPRVDCSPTLAGCGTC
jgi:hypothetical protein